MKREHVTYVALGLILSIQIPFLMRQVANEWSDQPLDVTSQILRLNSEPKNKIQDIIVQWEQFKLSNPQLSEANLISEFQNTFVQLGKDTQQTSSMQNEDLAQKNQQNNQKFTNEIKKINRNALYTEEDEGVLTLLKILGLFIAVAIIYVISKKVKLTKQNNPLQTGLLDEKAE